MTTHHFMGLHRILVVAVACIFSLTGFAAPVAAQSAPAAPPTGSLVRAVSGDPRLYYVDGAFKRWIDSPATLRFHGLRWAPVTLDDATLAAYPEGERLTSASVVILPGEAAILPDLAPLPPYDVRLATIDGRQVLRFTSSFANHGTGPFELITSAAERIDGYHDAYQRLSPPGGTYRDRFAGDVLWHPLHAHHHYNDFGEYAFELVRATDPAVTTVPPVLSKKTTFCLRDDALVSPGKVGAPSAKVYNDCGRNRQGVSVGWADIYPYTLADQFIDIDGLPAGLYRLSFVVDPRLRFLEARSDNNVSYVYVHVDLAAGTARVAAAVSPTPTSRNTIPDGTLVRAPSGAAYAVIAGKKQPLTAARAATYVPASGLTLDLPQAVVDAIPGVKLMRLAGTGAIYVVNDAGYRRRVLNPEVFSSYGWASADVVELAAEEFALYPETDLVMRSGDTRVYSTLTKKFVGQFGTLASLGRAQAAVHVVNRTDLAAYAVQTMASGLTVPWDVVFLPDGDMLVTERPGTLRRIGKQPATIALPSVLHVGEGGLMGMALHPDFAVNRQVYLYFTSGGEKKQNKISRFTLAGDALVDEYIILDGIPAALYHDGGQLAFAPDGKLYVTTGDAEEPALAQNTASLAGKTLRLSADGGIPADNPFGTAVWSYGHRNAQGIAWDAFGRMWQTEHGRSGATSGYDELNQVNKGVNYGWPRIQGDEALAGMVRPVVHSGATTTWAPSGIAYAGGKLYFAGLRGASLYEAALSDAGAVTGIKPWFAGVYGRLRAVTTGPDGFIYVTTSNRDGRGVPQAGDDKILRVHQDFLESLR